GPSLNILIKLMTIVALVGAPFFPRAEAKPAVPGGGGVPTIGAPADEVGQAPAEAAPARAEQAAATGAPADDRRVAALEARIDDLEQASKRAERRLDEAYAERVGVKKDVGGLKDVVAKLDTETSRLGRELGDHSRVIEQALGQQGAALRALDEELEREARALERAGSEQAQTLRRELDETAGALRLAIEGLRGDQKAHAE